MPFDPLFYNLIGFAAAFHREYDEFDIGIFLVAQDGHFRGAEHFLGDRDHIAKARICRGMDLSASVIAQAPPLVQQLPKRNFQLGDAALKAGNTRILLGRSAAVF